MKLIRKVSDATNQNVQTFVAYKVSNDAMLDVMNHIQEELEPKTNYSHFVLTLQEATNY